MHMDGKSAVVDTIGGIVQLLEKLRVHHADNVVQRTVVIGNDREQRDFLLAE